VNLQREGDVNILFDRQNKTQATILHVQEFEPQKGLERIPFSVVFWVKQNEVWPQKIYPILIRENQLLEVYLVPIGQHEGGIKYEAVYS
jgi:hypothetical protein